MILAGHIDSAVSGPGALLRLQDVRPGDRVTVVTAGRAYHYRVVALRAHAKQALPAAAVFGQQATSTRPVAEITASVPSGRFAELAEMATAVGYLASDESSYVTGVVLPVDGGLAM